MKSLQQLILILLIVLMICLALVMTAHFFYQTRVVKPYENFLSKEKETIPLFDALNEDVFQSLPPLPPNSSLQKKGAIGIIAPLYEHGRWLRIEFSTSQTNDFILKYYGSYLLANGWSENTSRHAFDNAFYHKGTSCIEVTPPSDVYPH